MGDGVALRPRHGGKIAVDQHLGIAPAGHAGHILRRHAPQLGGKAALQLLVGAAQRLGGKRDVLIFLLDRRAFGFHRAELALEHHRVAHRGKTPLERRNLSGELLGLGAPEVQLAPDAGGGGAAPDKIEVGQRVLLQLLLAAAGELIALARLPLGVLGGEDGGVALPVVFKSACKLRAVRHAIALQDRPALASRFGRVLLCLHVAREEHDRGKQEYACGDDISERVKNGIERDADRGQQKQQHDPERGVFLLIETLQLRHPGEIGVDAPFYLARLSVKGALAQLGAARGKPLHRGVVLGARFAERRPPLPQRFKRFAPLALARLGHLALKPRAVGACFFQLLLKAADVLGRAVHIVEQAS